MRRTSNETRLQRACGRTGLALAAAALALALGACALKAPPTREDLAASRPNLRPPLRWQAAGGADGAIREGWLAEIGDARLRALVQEALAYNFDLHVAAARIEQAVAYQRAAGSLLYPQVKALGRQGGHMGGDASGLQGVGLFINWELDVWGRVRAGTAAADAQFAAAALDAEYARQSVAAHVAKGWYLAIEAGLQKELAEHSVADSVHLAALAAERRRVGVGDELDVALTQANLDALRANLHNLDLARQQALRSLEALLGRYPAAQVPVATQLTTAPPPVPASLPAALLERRPDVVAAERRVAAAMYATEQAKAARLPAISLTGGVNSVSSELFVLKDRNNPVWSAGASIAAPIFLGGQLQSQVELRSAQQAQALAEYGRIGARAFGEVENALSAGFALDARERVLHLAEQKNQQAVRLAQNRFDVGATDMRALLQQNLALYAVQSTLLQVRAERLVQRVNLHLALGGSFDEQPAVQAAAGTGTDTGTHP